MDGSNISFGLDQVVCKFNRADGYEWSITFIKPIYEFLADHVGDVHHWAEQQFDLIVRGQMKIPEAVLEMRRVKRGEKLSQRAINNVIRARASSLYMEVIEGF